MSRRSRTFKLAAAVLGLALGLVAAEVVARYVEEARRSRINQHDGDNIARFRAPHPVYHHGFVPNGRAVVTTQEYAIAYRINALGLRDDPVDHSKFKVLVLGDSYTEGFGVNKEDTFPGNMDRMAPHIDFLNAGVASYSPTLEYLFVKTRFDEIRPNLVLLFLDANDPADDYMAFHGVHGGWYDRRAVTDHTGELVAVEPNPGGARPQEGSAHDKRTKKSSNAFVEKLRASRPVTEFLRSRFALYRLLGTNYDYSPKLPPEQLGDPKVDRYGHYRPAKGHDWTPMYRTSLAYIVKLRDFLARRGVKLAVVTYPYAISVHPNEWDEGRERWLFEVGKVYETDYFDFYIKELQRVGIPHLCLLDYLRQWKKDHWWRRLYFRWDGHFNPYGTRVVAERVYAWLREQRLLPEPGAGGGSG